MVHGSDNPLQAGKTIRVWAEERGPNIVLVSWARPDGDPAMDQTSVDAASDARAVAATIGVLQGVTSAASAEDGVLVELDPAIVSKARIAQAVRSALTQDGDLKTRANDLMKRVPAYATLARSLALDERVSPIPQAARQATAARGAPLGGLSSVPIPARLIPGLPWLMRLNMVVPVLRELGQWSREAPPEVVDEHLLRAGLARSTLDRDLATAQEALAFARDYASQTAGKVFTQASSLTAQATARAREWVRQRTPPPDEPTTPSA
jgi:hypothetical protein